MIERLDWLLKDNLKLLTNKTILILGLGGVGGYSVEALARCGVKKLIIVDNDVIDKTNINRQIIALHSTIGFMKTELFEKRIYDINPSCEVVKINEFITKNNLDILFNYKIDYLIDACDTVETKKEVIKHCLKNKIKFISSMGMAKRVSASKIKISTLDKTQNDPLAKKMRVLFKKEKINSKIPVVYSDELPLKSDKLGSIITVSATAGIMCADYVINDMLKGVKHE